MSTARFNTLQNAAGSKSVPVDTVASGYFSTSGNSDIQSFAWQHLHKPAYTGVSP